MGKNLGNERVGEIRKNNFGSHMEIVEYFSADDILVKFEKGKPVHTSWNHFYNGKVRYVYDRTVFGIGFIGEGKYKVKENRKIILQYKYWNNMLRRCYDEKTKEKHLTYKDCIVCEEWHNFQVFAKWFDENYYEVGNEQICLDKDILIKGNKLYSPETCVFVTQRINKLFIKKDINRGDYPIGVYFNKINNNYSVQCHIGDGGRKRLGSLNTPEEAFQVYKITKENYIKEVANEYKGKIPLKLYDGMLSYKVEIND